MNTTGLTKHEIVEENRRLAKAVEELSVLNEIAVAVASAQSLEDIVALIVKKCIKHLGVEQCALQLLNDKDREKPFITMIRKQNSVSNLLPYRLNTQLTGWMLKNKCPLLINSLFDDPRFKIVIEKDSPFRSMLSVPMMIKGRITGLLTVFNKQTSEEGFTLDDQRLLGIIASQSAQVIENARLYQHEQALLRLQEEMKLAYEIQVNLLPKSQPQLNGYQVSGRSIPAKEVGGDCFNFIPLDENRLAFCLGDISGKGIPAALLMANLQAILQGQALAGKYPKDCVAFSNKILYHNVAPGKFATLFYGIIDNSKNQLIYSNAGHNNPFLISDGNRITRLDKGGMILGILPSEMYEEETSAIQIGDVLVIFSDGITESMNNLGEEFGEQRLLNMILKNRQEEALSLINSIFSEVKKYSGGQPQMDDQTLVVIKRVA